MQEIKQQAVVLLDTVSRLRMVVTLCDVSEGYCCCGDSMDRHSSWDLGHSAVDAGEYYAGMSVEKAEKAADSLSSAVMSKDPTAVGSALKEMALAIDGLEATLDRVSIPPQLPFLLTNKEIEGKEFSNECVKMARDLIQMIAARTQELAALSASKNEESAGLKTVIESATEKESKSQRGREKP